VERPTRQVKELMKLQNIAGDPQDFIPGYKKELATVTKMRLKEVSPAVAQYVRAKKLAVRLRMLLEVKRDMRRKGRLVLQGFRAPSWWRIGSTDSPVVATAGLRVLIFRRVIKRQAAERSYLNSILMWLFFKPTGLRLLNQRDMCHTGLTQGTQRRYTS
jgi:hypothetical protein